MRKTRTTKPEAKPRAILYGRVSTKEQAEKDLSLPSQFDIMRRYCTEKEFEVVEEITEPGRSARDDNRKEFNRMMRLVLAPSADIQSVLVAYTSRFMRNTAKAKIWKERLRKQGIRVIAVRQETADDPSGHLMETVLEAFDQYESEINGLRTAAAMQENAERGYFNGSNAPYGYKAEKIPMGGDKFKRKLVPNPEEISTHNEVLRLYVASTGAKAVARELNQRELRYRKGKFWTKDLVLRVVDEKAAIGTYFWGERDSAKRVGTDDSEELGVPINVEPIVDRELFEMAQRLRRSRDPKRNPGRTPSSPMLLAGLVCCGRPGCGASYQLETSGKNADSGVYDYRYYNCRNHLRIGREKCEGFRVRAEVLEQAILEHIAERLFTPERCTQILQDIVEETGLLRQKTTDHRRQFQKELDDIEKRLRRWTEAFETGDAVADLGAERVAELKAKRDELRQTLAKVVPLWAPPPYLYSEASIKKFQESLRTIFLSRDTSLTKNYLKFLVEKIIVNGPKVQMVTRSEAVVRMMAGANGSPAGVAERDPAVSPTFEVGWLRLQDSNLRPGG